MKRGLRGTLTAAALLVVAAAVLAQSDVIVLNYGARMFQPVRFPHARHAGEMNLGCTICHHAAADRNAVQACSGCHQLESQGETIPIKDAFHKSCRKCHQRQRSEGRNPPTSCTGCHQRSS